MLRTDAPAARLSGAFGRLVDDQRGTVAVEYVVLASMISLIVIGVAAYTGAMSDIFNSFAGYFS